MATPTVAAPRRRSYPLPLLLNALCRKCKVPASHEAVVLLDEPGLPTELSQARLAYGRVLASVGDHEEARNQLGRAWEACVQMGATGLLAEVERELERVGSGTGLAGPAPESI